MDLRRGARPRRGITLLELSVGVVLLAAAAVVLAQVLGWVAAERRASDRRARALREAANVLESLGARPWAELTPDAAAGLELPPSAVAALPGAALAATVDGPGDAGLKRLHVEVRWRERGAEAPVRLTAWVGRRDAEGGE